MSMSTLAYARCAYKSFSRSARHLLQLIAGHQNLQTGWAYLSYQCLSEESSLTRRRVMQLVAFLEVQGALEVRRGHGRGHVNFYRILREEDRLPVPHKKVKSGTSSSEEKVKFPTPPTSEKVNAIIAKPAESLGNVAAKVIETEERKDKTMPMAHAPEPKAEMRSPYWCPDCGFAIPSCEHRTISHEQVLGSD